jgi:FMN phosphatase YigB (HAD superfamily)
MIHIGNDLKADVDAPASLGIKSYLIDREGKHTGDHVIQSLRELKNII